MSTATLKTEKLMKYLLTIITSLVLSGLACAGYFHGQDNNGNSWNGTSGDGYFHGQDSNGNSWNGTYGDGYYHGQDSNGNSWSGTYDDPN